MLLDCEPRIQRQQLLDRPWEPPSFGYLFGIAIGRAAGGGALIGAGYLAVLLLFDASSPGEVLTAVGGAAAFGVPVGGTLGTLVGMMLAGPAAGLLRSIPPWQIRWAAVAGLVTIGALSAAPIAILGLAMGGGRSDPALIGIVAASGAYGAFSGHRMVIAGSRKHQRDPDA